MIRRSLVGSFVTALDMDGASITLVRCDEQLLDLWDAPTAAPGWPNAPAGEFRGIANESEVRFRSNVASREDEPEVSGTADTLGRAPVGAWIGAFVEKVLAEEANLTDLDRRAGDGDFGTNMAAALDHVDVPRIRDSYSPADGVRVTVRRLSRSRGRHVGRAVRCLVPAVLPGGRRRTARS